MIFSLLHRTLVGLEKLIHAPSPSLVTARKKEMVRRIESADLSAESGQFSLRKLVGSSVSDEASEFYIKLVSSTYF